MIKGKRVISIIPARGGSKGIPRKNIKLLAGKPLIAYTIEEAKKSRYLDKVIVSTDDNEIAEISKKYGAEIPFMRDKRFATDDIPVLPDTIQYVVDELEKRDIKSDIVSVLQPTSPLRKVKYIDMAIERLVETDADFVASVSEVECHPYRMRIINEDNRIIPLINSDKIWAQRQELPKVYKINGAIYIIRKEILKIKDPLKKGKWYYVVMDGFEGIDIDNYLDFIVCEEIRKNRRKVLKS